MSSSGHSHVLLGLILFAAITSNAVADPVLIDRRDLWSNPACKASPQPSDDPSASSVMVDFDERITDDFRAIRPAAALTAVDGAYAYADAHCYLLRMGDADALFDAHEYRRAFAAYDLYEFSPDGSSHIGPPYYDSTAVPPLREGLHAASQGAYVHAAAYFRAAIAKAADFEDPHLFLGEVLYLQGDTKGARLEWLRALNSLGIVVMNKDTIGPDPAWTSALRLFEIHKG